MCPGCLPAGEVTLPGVDGIGVDGRVGEFGVRDGPCDADQGAGLAGELGPDGARLPPTLIGGVGAESEQDGQCGAQDGRKQRGQREPMDAGAVDQEIGRGGATRGEQDVESDERQGPAEVEGFLDDHRIILKLLRGRAQVPQALGLHRLTPRWLDAAWVPRPSSQAA